jgi:hypothetical protein
MAAFRQAVESEIAPKKVDYQNLRKVIDQAIPKRTNTVTVVTAPPTAVFNDHLERWRQTLLSREQFRQGRRRWPLGPHAHQK